MTEPRRYSPLLQLTLARTREFYREPEAVFWVFVFPLLMTLALGVAFRGKPAAEHFAIDLRAGDDAAHAARTLRDDPRLTVTEHSEEACLRRLRTGKADLVVVPHSSGGTGDDQVTYEYHVDPTKPGSLLAHDVVDGLLQRAAGRTDPAATRTVEHQERGGRYIDFLVPGLLGLGLMGGGLWGLGFVIVDMRIRGVLKRFLATPMRRSDFLLALIGSRLTGMIPEVLALLGFGWLAFGVTSQGNLLLVFAVLLLGAVMFAGIGLLVACRAKTLEAVSGLMNLVMLPMWVLSGTFFAADRFPQAAQPIIRALPLTLVNDALREVMLDGAGIAAVLPRVAGMAAWAALSFALALRWFRWS